MNSPHWNLLINTLHDYEWSDSKVGATETWHTVLNFHYNGVCKGIVFNSLMKSCKCTGTSLGRE